MQKKKKLIIVLIVVLGIIILTGGIFWAGKKFGERKKVSQTENNQKFELERELQQLKNQLQKETNPTKKQELERKIEEKNSELKKLGDPNTLPTPNQNPPVPGNPNNQSPPTPSQKTFTVKCNGAVGGKCEYINASNPQERILIDTKNKIFYSDDVLYIKGNQYTISFNEEDAAKKGNDFVFDENNDKFQLTPITSPTPQTPPQPPNNNPNQIEIEVKWGGGSGKKNYWLLSTPNTLPKDRKSIFISKKNPAVKGKKFAHKITPTLKISFAEKDVSQKLEDNKWLFDENNQKFAITPLANWPDDPNYQNEIEDEEPKTVEKKLKGGAIRNDYIGFTKVSSENKIEGFYWVHNGHPEVKRLGLTSALEKNRNALDGRKFTLSFESVERIEHDSHFFFEQGNDSLEIKEEN